MQYRYLKNLKEQKAYKFTDPLQVQKKKPKFANKAKYREWCADNDTDHVFYSMVEGDNPNLRVQGDNPPNFVFGVVADYDAPVDWDLAMKIIKTQCKDHLPTWMSKTQSGYIRLVWEHEKTPTSKERYTPYMNIMCNELSLERIFAGFDRSSLKANQYFELGEDWVRIGDPLDNSLIQKAILKAAMSKPPQSSETSIPMEVVGKEVMKKFPNRWLGEFTEGERGPLFWIDDGIEREGCAITKDGMLCFSDRAGKDFVPWKEILGSKFVKDFETAKLGDILDNYWFNGTKFFKLLHGTAVTIPKELLILELRNLGFTVDKKKKPISEVEAAVISICNENRIDEIAPIIWSKERVVQTNSNRILNSQNIHPIEPADNGDKKNWKFINKWLGNFFVDEDIPTIYYFNAWMKRFYESVLYRVPMQGQGFIVVGPTGRGKTLLARRVIGALVGGYSDASEYVSGQTAFNKELARVPCWCVDDTKSAASYQEQRKATENFKMIVANPDISYMAKYCDDISIPWSGRIVLTLNMDANSLSVIPSLDSSNRDKIMAVRIREDALSKFPPNDELEAIILEELPFYAKYLLDWNPPKEIIGKSRYGVKSFIDKEIASAAYDNSSRSSVVEVVEFLARGAREYVKPEDGIWTGLLGDLIAAVESFNGGRTYGCSNKSEFVRRGLLIIEEACKTNKHIRPVKSLGRGGGKLWQIDISEKYDINKIIDNE